MNNPFKQVIVNLHKNDIHYVIARNHEAIIQSRFEDLNDIDILINIEEIDKVHNIFRACNFIHCPPFIFFDHSYYCIESVEDKPILYLFHIQYANHHKGLIYSDNRDIINRRERCQDFNIPNNKDQYALYLLNLILNNNWTDFKNKFTRLNKIQEKLDETDKKNIFEIRLSLGLSAVLKFLGLNSHEKVIALLNSKKNFYLSKILMEAVLFLSLKNSFYFFLYKLTSLLNLMKTYLLLKRKSKVIVILGGDGAGKSSLIENFKQEFQSGPILFKEGYFGLNHHQFLLTKVTLYPWRFLMRSFSYRRKNSLPSRNQKKECGSVIKYLFDFFNFILKPFYYLVMYIEMLYRYIKLNFNCYAKHFTVVCCDRYPYDFLTEHKVTHLVWLKLFPRPDLIIYLDPPLKILIDRKGAEYNLNHQSIEQLEQKKDKHNKTLSKIFSQNGISHYFLDTSIHDQQHTLKIARDYLFQLFNKSS